MVDTDRIAPSNVEAEQAVLGALLLDPGAVTQVVPILAPADFFRPSHQKIYRAVLELFQAGEAVDYLTLRSALERSGDLEAIGGMAYLTELVSTTPVAQYAENYALLVERSAIMRRLIDAAGRIAQLAWQDEAETVQETIDRAEAAMYDALGNRGRRDLLSLREILDAYFEKIEEIQAHRAGQLGTPTGFVDLDRLLGGLQPSDLCVVAGRPGMGKTSWLLSVADQLAIERELTVAVFSLEMSSEQLAQRLLASRTGISTKDLRLGQIRDDELELLMRAIGELSGAPLYIDDTPGLTPFEMRAKARRLGAERGLDLVIVDYLQLMHSGSRSENRVQEIGFISRSLKAMARELRVPVIAASQLSRAVESRADRRPQLSDLRESGAIEQDADMVLFLYRDEIYNPDTDRKGIAEVTVAKHRHGPTGTVELVFIPHETRFADLAMDGAPAGGFGSSVAAPFG